MKPVTVSSTHDWAVDYLQWCVHEGLMEPDEIENLTHEQMIDLATTLEANAEANYDAQKEEIL